MASLSGQMSLTPEISKLLGLKEASGGVHTWLNAFYSCHVRSLLSEPFFHSACPSSCSDRTPTSPTPYTAQWATLWAATHRSGILQGSLEGWARNIKTYSVRSPSAAPLGKLGRCGSQPKYNTLGDREALDTGPAHTNRNEKHCALKPKNLPCRSQGPAISWRGMTHTSDIL